MNRSFYYTVIVSLGGFIFGFDASVISGAISFVSQEFQLSDIQQGMVVSAPTLGSMLAIFVAGAICDAIGRRKMLLAISALYIFSALASTFAVSYYMLLSARFIGGLAFCCLMIAPMYIAEISRAENRGRMVSVNQLNIVLGFSAAYFANYFILLLSQNEASWVTQLGIAHYTWRWMLAVELVPATLFFVLLFSIPESPRWLHLKGDKDKAREIMQRLYSHDIYHQEYARLKEAYKPPKQGLEQRLKKLMSPSLRLALLIGLIVAVAQQISGINAVFFYAPSIFEQSGVGTNAAFMQASLVGLINVIFTVLAILLIDSLGRKPLLLGGLLGVFISMSTIAYGFSQASYQLNESDIVELSRIEDLKALSQLQDKVFTSDVEFKQAVKQAVGENSYSQHQGQIIASAASMNSILILFGILGFVASFAISLGPVMWVLFSEIFPTHMRGIAISCVGIVNSAASFLVQFIFPWELNNLGSATTFLLYGLGALVCFFLIAKIVPETKGKSLEHLEVELAGKTR